MKKLLLITTAILLVSALILGGCGEAEKTTETVITTETSTSTETSIETSTKTETATETIQPIILKVGNPDPEMYLTAAVLEEWGAKVEQETGGKVIFQYYHNGVLAPMPEMLDGIIRGVMDVGIAPEGVWADRLAINFGSCTCMTGITTAEAGTHVRWELWNKFQEFQDEFKDVHILALYTTTPRNIHTKTAIYNLADLEGMRIRAPKGDIPVAEALKVVPVSVGMPDAYLNLQKGIVDGILCADADLEEYSLAEVTDYTTEVNLFVAPFFIAMNLETWESLPPDVQDVIDGLREWFSFRFAEEMDASHAEAIEFATDYGHEFINPTPAALDEFIDIMYSLHAQWADDLESQGKPGNAILDEIYRLVEEYK